MTIRRQLAFSYLAIFTLLGLNLLNYFWTDTMRQSAFEDLRRAISRQTLISSVQQQLGDYNKQVTLLVQITGEGGPSAPSKSERDQFNGHLDQIAREIREIGAHRMEVHRIQADDLGRRRDEDAAEILIAPFAVEPVGVRARPHQADAVSLGDVVFGHDGPGYRHGAAVGGSRLRAIRDGCPTPSV